MSFGSWVATTVGAAKPRVSLLMAIAPAVGHISFDALKTTPKPAFLIHGEEDDVARSGWSAGSTPSCRSRKSSSVIEGADHVFDGMTSIVADALEDLLGDFRETKETTTPRRTRRTDTKSYRGIRNSSFLIS